MVWIVVLICFSSGFHLFFSGFHFFVCGFHLFFLVLHQLGCFLGCKGNPVFCFLFSEADIRGSRGYIMGFDPWPQYKKSSLSYGFHHLRFKWHVCTVCCSCI